MRGSGKNPLSANSRKQLMKVADAHVVTVDGYNGDSMHIVDPENGTYWISKSAFNAAYSYMKFAVAIS